MDHARAASPTANPGNRWRERVIAALGGAITAIAAARRRSPRSAQRSRAAVATAGVEQRRTLLVKRPRGEVYRRLRNLENLPRFLDHVTAVTVIDDRTSRWTIRDRGAA